MSTIVYIAGTRRTGSTILDILLGSALDAFSVGQLADLHHSDSCTCGEVLNDCPIWSNVLEHPDLPASDKLEKLANLTRKEVGLPAFLASRELCERFANAQDRVYDAVLDTVPQQTLIDSSKNMTRAFALLRAGRHDVRILHVIRDPRGFMDSIRRQQIRGGKRQLPRPVIMTEWLLKQITASGLLARAADRYLRIRYEDLLLDPSSTLDRIERFSGLDLASVIRRIRERKAFSPDHIFAGNRVSRMKQVVFDSSRIETNRLTSMSRRLFWYSMGWPAAFWGYDREQSYLRVPSAE